MKFTDMPIPMGKMLLHIVEAQQPLSLEGAAKALKQDPATARASFDGLVYKACIDKEMRPTSIGLRLVKMMKSSNASGGWGRKYCEESSEPHHPANVGLTVVR